jgi:superkiller protein 3
MTWLLVLLLIELVAQADPQQPSAPPATAQGTTSPAVPIRELEAAVDRSPNDPKLWVLLGLAYLDQNDDPRALSAFERAVKVGPKSAEAHNWLGVALAEKADLPAAAAELRKAVELDPQYGRAYTNLGSVLAQSGDYGEAVKIFQKALTLEPNSLGARMNLGMALRETGNLEDALKHLRSVVTADPNNASLQYELGQTLRQSGDLSGAVVAFQKALEIQPEQREAYYALGVALKQQSAALRKPRPAPASRADDLYKQGQEAIERGDFNSGRERLTEALRLDENHAEAHALLGFTLGQQGDLSSGLRHLERAVKLRPESSDARYNLGAALWYSGSRDRAITALQESVKLDPAAGPSHAFLGMALRERSDWTGARVHLQRAIALLPATTAVYIDLGITYLRAGDLDKALGQLEAGLNLPSPSSPAPEWKGAAADLRKALAAQPGRAEAHNVLGRLLGRAGAGTDDVAAAFREAIRIQPGFAQARNNLGLVLIQAGDDQAGIAALREAVRISPEYAEARVNLGAALTPTDSEAAITELEKAVALAPNSLAALFNLAVAYGSSPKHGPSKEIELLRRVIEQAPTFARAQLALGKALLRDGQVPDAVGALREAARLEPTSGEAHYQLGLALARAGQKDEAAVELQKGRELVAAADRTQNASLDIAEGRAALESGDTERAAGRFRRAIELQPNSSEARRYLGTVLEKQGNIEGAADAYRKALELNPADAAAKERLGKLTENPPTKSEDAERRAEFERFIRDEKFKEVEPLLADYVKERPQSSWGWYALGYSLFAQQKIGDSIKALARSLELDITNAEAHKILGRNLMIIGRFDAAQVEFQQAIKYKPDSAESHYNLGKLFSIQDNWEPARRAFEAALKIDPAYVEALDALGLAQESLGDDAAAVASYEKAVALNAARQGHFASAHINLSAYYNRAGDPQKALDYAQAALALDRNSDRALFQKARAEERLDNLSLAVNALNEAISINPRASSYYYVLAGVYRRLGWMDESQKALEVFRRLERESTELEKKRRRDSRP